MGQQQLILLVLGTIIVGVAIVVGINVFTSGAVKANEDAVVQDNLTIASRAINYSRTPSMMGGGFDETTGVKSFEGLTLEKMKWPQNNANGSYRIVVTPTIITIYGTGLEPTVAKETIVTLNEDGPPTIVTN
jgi:hypothetical protein